MEDVLFKLLGMRRADGSLTEASVVPFLMRRLAEVSDVIPLIDSAGNLHYDLCSDRSHRTLFVAHTDTVHHKGGTNRYALMPDSVHAVDQPLGADDAAGVAILCTMIEYGIPGYYIFTRGEECGGRGSKYLANEWDETLEQFDRAIAFDRRGTSDVITHQFGGECCSNEFAEALSDALNASDSLLYMPSDRGVYTDTAEFTELIPECTNISAGYFAEHSDQEWLDLNHWRALRDACLMIEWDALPTVRQLYVEEVYVDPFQAFDPEFDDPDFFYQK